MGDGISSVQKLLILVAVVIIVLLAIVGVTQAQYGSEVSISDDNIIHIMAKPSVSSNLPYKWFNTTFENKCAFCGEKLLVNPKEVPESELTCSYCDADFCGVSGKDKEYREIYLTKV